MGKFFDEKRFSLMDIIIFACFISLVFSPVGIFLMWLKSKWAKKTKIIVSGVFALVCAVVVVTILLLNIKPKEGGGGGNTFIGKSQNIEGSSGYGKSSDRKSSSKSNKTGKGDSNQPNSQNPTDSFVRNLTKSRWAYAIVLFLIMLVLIVIRNLKSGKSGEKNNPYVDTNLYKIPIPNGFTFPKVNFSKLTLQKGEKILFATPAELKDNPGDIVITNNRFVFLGRKENYNFQIKSISSIYSLSNTTLSVSVSEKTHYFFIPDTQMRFVLQIVRYAYMM